MTKKSGLADSPFFSAMQPQQAAPPVETVTVQPTPAPLSPVDETPIELEQPLPVQTDIPEKPVVEEAVPRHHDAVQPDNRDTVIPRNHEEILNLVRRAVRELGKEAATHRFTQEEKRRISEIVYTYKMQDVRTTENEITRIAVNYLIEDYRAHGENSILDKLLKALNE